MPSSPRVLISYSHDSADHQSRVLELAQRLRKDGVDAWIDRFEPAPAQGWPRWMQEQVEASAFIVIVCTPTYRRRFEGKQAPGVGRGVSWEGLLVQQLRYEGRFDDETLVPVLFEGAVEEHIPTMLRGGTRHELPGDYAGLLAHLTRRLAVPPAPLGELPIQPAMPALPSSRDFEAGSKRLQARIFEGPGSVPVKKVPNFVGRTDELAELERLLLGDDRTVCVVATGIGGIGKTTLAEEFVATRARELFSDGVAWLDGGELIAELGRVSRRFGWAEQREPTPAEALRVLGQLHAKPVLLVVDNFDPKQGDPDHVPAPGGRCRTLVTSRVRPLAARLDAASLELGVWTLDACREYLRERCPRLKAAADTEVDALAKFVGRLPLGVRLLVLLLRNRVGMGPTKALKLLEQQPLGALDKFDADRGIAATFQFSYDALTDDGRCVLQALAVCAKQTRAAVVEAVAAAGDVGELLDDLHARGLAEFSGEAGAPWGLHDVIRMFVLEQPGREGFEAAHTRWVRAHLEEHSEPTAYREFGAGVDEARRAFERLLEADIDQADTIYRPLEDHLTVVGRNPQAIALSESMLEAASPESEQASEAMNCLGLCYQTLGDTPKAIDFHQRSLAIHEKLGRLHGQAGNLGNLGPCYQTLGDIPKAIDFHQRSLAIHEKLGHLEGQASNLGNLGICYRTLGDIPKAIDFLQRSLTIDETLGRLEGQANQLANLGLCYRMQGDIPKAIDFLQRSLAIHEQLGRLEGQANQLANLGFIAARHGTPEQARDYLTRALDLYGRMGIPDDHSHIAMVSRALVLLD